MAGETSDSYGFHLHVNNGHWQYGIRKPERHANVLCGDANICHPE